MFAWAFRNSAGDILFDRHRLRWTLEPDALRRRYLKTGVISLGRGFCYFPSGCEGKAVGLLMRRGQPRHQRC